MVDKFAKNEVCRYCNRKMESKYRSKKFCSPKCRVYWNRENSAKKIKSLDDTPPAINELSFSTNVENVNKPVAAVSKKEMPNNLDKSERLRWIRENW